MNDWLIKVKGLTCMKKKLKQQIDQMKKNFDRNVFILDTKIKATECVCDEYIEKRRLFKQCQITG